jgi:hypothetical protein
VLAPTLLAAALAAQAATGTAGELAAGDALKAAFLDPPPESRPRVWWHWMNGNVTREGIASDLEWMARIGIGGVQNFDAAMESPVIVDQRLVYMSPEWRDAFRFAVEKADALGLEFTIASSPGWSETGGPWVTPDDAMKKVVWSERIVTGGQEIQVALPQPPGVPGPFLDLHATYKHAHNDDAIPDSFYRDALVLAYPLELHAPVTTPASTTANGVPMDPAVLVDGDYATGIELPAKREQDDGVIEITYPSPQTVRSAELFIKGLPASVLSGPLLPRLEALGRDRQWLPLAQFRPGKVPATVSFAPVTSDRFRVVLARGKRSGKFNFSPAPGFDPSGLGSVGSGPSEPPLLTELQLSGQPRIDAFELKAAFELVDDYHALDSDADAGAPAVDPGTVLDISSSMTAAGDLHWDAPPGTWKILRLGYSLTGKTNSPASQEATGLEVDKYDAAAVQRYLDTYLDMYRAVVGEAMLGQRGLGGLLTDSTEVGPSNWTPRLRERFAQLRGYDPTPWLPTLSGELVGSRQQSDRFLYDFRRTLADLAVSDHYGTVARVAHDNGLTVYGEALEANRDVATLGDDLEMRRHADIPMAAMWTYGRGKSPADKYVADMRGAASVAHIYGKQLVAAESLTSILAPWAHAPADLQPMIDAEFANGINRPVIHTSVHQPVDDHVPGLSLHVFGQFFTRHETWAEMAKPWVDYLSRNSFLLQQGRNVADVAYFYGEEPPLGVLVDSRGYPQDTPTRHAYDFLPPHALLHEMFVDNGELVTRGGARYKALYLGRSSTRFMTLPVLARMRQLVEDGATVIGMAPQDSPSLADDKKRFADLVGELWDNEDTTRVGKGRVIASNNIDSALQNIEVLPDFTANGDVSVQFVHRQLADGDLYYLSNRGAASEFEASFRVTGRTPEIWRADSGAIEPVSYRMQDGQTRVSLAMGNRESFFVVFRNPTTLHEQLIKPAQVRPLKAIAGGWQVAFQGGRGAPESATLDQLISLSDHTDPGIRYFSGIATYTTDFSLAAFDPASGSLLLDLGDVGDVAEVRVNGMYAGTAWKPPYQVDISDAVETGINKLEVRVANLWVNRLVGDRQTDATPITYTTFKTYLPSAPLRTSGLVGPVNLAIKQTVSTATTPEEARHE